MKNTSMVRRGFRNDKTPAILEHPKRLYGTPSLQELYEALLRLHEPIDCNQPVQLIIRTNEEFQMFLMENSDGDRELSNVNLIIYVMIKLSKFDGL